MESRVAAAKAEAGKLERMKRLSLAEKKRLKYLEGVPHRASEVYRKEKANYCQVPPALHRRFLGLWVASCMQEHPTLASLLGHSPLSNLTYFAARAKRELKFTHTETRRYEHWKAAWASVDIEELEDELRAVFESLVEPSDVMALDESLHFMSHFEGLP